MLHGAIGSLVFFAPCLIANDVNDANDVWCLGLGVLRSGEDNTMPANTKIEKFSARELLNLRNELLQSGIDTWQAAEVLSGFLTGRGYGVSAPAARNAITRLEEMGCNLDCMQAELENLAFVM
jgi:hypothetical protein